MEAGSCPRHHQPRPSSSPTGGFFLLKGRPTCRTLRTHMTPDDPSSFCKARNKPPRLTHRHDVLHDSHGWRTHALGLSLGLLLVILCRMLLRWRGHKTVGRVALWSEWTGHANGPVTHICMVMSVRSRARAIQDTFMGAEGSGRVLRVCFSLACHKQLSERLRGRRLIGRLRKANAPVSSLEAGTTAKQPYA